MGSAVCDGRLKQSGSYNCQGITPSMMASPAVVIALKLMQNIGENCQALYAAMWSHDTELVQDFY